MSKALRWIVGSLIFLWYAPLLFVRGFMAGVHLKAAAKSAELYEETNDDEWNLHAAVARAKFSKADNKVKATAICCEIAILQAHILIRKLFGESTGK